MAFAVKVHKLTDLRPIENADSIELALINDWPLVVRKGEYQVGDLVVYFPNESVLPDELIEKMGLVGKLAGGKKNRVKAIRLRKQLSIGLLCKAPFTAVEGEDLTSFYGVIKFEEEVPLSLRGKIRPKYAGFVKYDIENIRNEKDWFVEGELIEMREKIHGCSTSMGFSKGEFHVASRNLSIKEEEGNVYWQVARKYDIENILRREFNVQEQDIFVCGEIFGPIQDLRYGQNEPTLAIFDIKDLTTGSEVFWSCPELSEFCDRNNLPMAPLLYSGPFSKEILISSTNGLEMVSGRSLHIREGCVVKPIKETTIGQCRKILKSVSEAYLLRKDGTEYH